VYSTEGKARTLIANGGGGGAKMGLYAVPLRLFEDEQDFIGQAPETTEPIILQRPHGYNRGGAKYGKAPTLTANGRYEANNHFVAPTGGGQKIIYTVKDGVTEYKGARFPIKLPDGQYTIRKFTVKECCRLQTLPDDYFLNSEGERVISDTQCMRCLGNGWTAEVIIHLLSYGLRDVPRGEPLEVLSMYDGIATGRYCLERLGFSNITYCAYEVDKYAITAAKNRYPDIIECGDAFAVRDADWCFGDLLKTISG
jgi:DNA (cytosine-5)-methyltransferase 3A